MREQIRIRFQCGLNLERVAPQSRPPSRSQLRRIPRDFARFPSEISYFLPFFLTALGSFLEATDFVVADTLGAFFAPFFTALTLTAADFLPKPLEIDFPPPALAFFVALDDFTTLLLIATFTFLRVPVTFGDDDFDDDDFDFLAGFFDPDPLATAFDSPPRPLEGPALTPFTPPPKAIAHPSAYLAFVPTRVMVMLQLLLS